MMLNSTMKKTFRAALAIVCAGTLMAGTAACGSTSSSGGDKVALLVSTLNNPFFVDLRDGAQAAAKDLGVDLMVSDAQNLPWPRCCLPACRSSPWTVPSPVKM